MARLKEENEQLSKQLITKLTAFQENEENFALCLQFTQSNFRFHRFLDVDSHRVTRLIDGLCTKFKVHSLGERAEELRNHVESFLQSPLDDGELNTKTDTHYGILLLLCLLANSPTSANYQPAPCLPQEEPQDTFDWGAHLLEGEGLWSARYSSSSQSEEESLRGSSDEEEETDRRTVADRKSPVLVPSQADSRPVSALPLPQVSLEDTAQLDDVEDWLQRNIMAQYWKGQGQKEELGRHSSSNLLKDWTSYQVRSGEVYAMVGQRVVTEYQLVREILWMLTGVDSLFMFELTSHGWKLNSAIRLAHLSGASLENCVNQLTQLASRLRQLRLFVGDVVGACCRPLAMERPYLGSQTFQAFADSLSCILNDFRCELSQLERKIAQQADSDGSTIASVMQKLSPWLPALDAVWEVFVSGVNRETDVNSLDCGENPRRICNSGHASRLLTALYNGVAVQDCLGQAASGDGVSLLMKLLLETSRPYLDIISQWISAGRLSDPACEFVLLRNETIPSLDETFWERAFTLNSSATSGDCRRDVSNTSLSSAGLSPEEEEPEQVFQDLLEASPKFLGPVMREVVLTGKSMELLQALGRLPEVLASVGGGLKEGKTLYHLFIDSLREVLGTAVGVGGEKATVVGSTTQTLLPRTGTMQREDCLLQINFKALFHDVFVQRAVPNDTFDLSVLGSMEEAYISPVSLLFERCLYPHIHQRYQHVCRRLLDIFKHEYRLMDFLSSMQQFYLMSAGDAMFDFYTPMFDKMRHQEMWRDPSSLTLALQEALQSRHAQHTNRLSLSLEQPTKPRERSAVSATDCIRLHFNVPWPVDVVISSKCQTLYNQVFLYLLQIKRAKYSLDQLRFSDLDKSQMLTVNSEGVFMPGVGFKQEEIARSERLHRLHILRFRLAYFVNSLHNYIMTRILHSTGLEFEDEIKKATDLEQVIEVHARYVRTIHERCLLHKKLAFLKDAVSRVLNLTLSFGMRWDQGVHNISGQTVSEMEEEFSRCIQFLASFLNNIIKRGSFPHVEPLAYALVTSLPSSGKYS